MIEQAKSNILGEALKAELKQLIREGLKEEMTASGNRRAGPDRLVDIEQAAKMLAVSADWLYHNRKTLPFVRKLGRKMLRFSVNGMQKWMEAKKFS